MTPLKFTLAPQSPFGTPLKGDTLFGQLCWAVRHRFGQARLAQLLEGYTAGRPFAVVSDAFPAGFLPRPALPLYRFGAVGVAERKRIRKQRWIASADFSRPVQEWLALAKSDQELAEQFSGQSAALSVTRVQPHNTIHRLTGTTASGEFAPYGMTQHWYCRGLALEVYLAYDPARIECDELVALMRDVGQMGYGRDATIGLGKFELIELVQAPWPAQANPNAWLTLAPCAPQGLPWNLAACWYQPFTRFGRHGDLAVHIGRPFKSPVLLADSGAVLTPVHFDPSLCFIGQGLGGDGSLSKAIEHTVQQGYAPVLPIRLEETA